jgi:3-hydroxyacyl-CoA dehydrogenase
MDVKRDVLAAAREAAPNAILATNTSSLSVEGMGADVGLHFFNPVAVMPLVEIVRTSQTTDEQLVTAWDIVKKLKKRGVLVGDAPGFVVNRLLTRMTTVLMEAIGGGNTPEEVDDAILSLGMPMAPSVLREMVGPAVAQHVLETMHGAWPDRFPLVPAPAERRNVEEIRERALEAVADEVQHLLAEGVVADPADVDACLILGAGWPLFLGGAVTRQPLRT